MLFSITAVPIFIPISRVVGLPLLHTVLSIYCLQTFWWWSFDWCEVILPCSFDLPFSNNEHWERPWCWERLKAGGEGDDRGWDGWMASLTQWTWVWVNSGSLWWTGKPGVLQSMGLQSWTWLSDWTEVTDEQCWTSFPVLFDHLYVFSGEVAI